jgi:hypothetical protein
MVDKDRSSAEQAKGKVKEVVQMPIKRQKAFVARLHLAN